MKEDMSRLHSGLLLRWAEMKHENRVLEIDFVDEQLLRNEDLDDVCA